MDWIKSSLHWLEEIDRKNKDQEMDKRNKDQEMGKRNKVLERLSSHGPLPSSEDEMLAKKKKLTSSGGWGTPMKRGGDYPETVPPLSREEANVDGVTEKEWLLFISKKMNLPLELLMSLSEKCKRSFSNEPSYCDRLSLKAAQAVYRPATPNQDSPFLSSPTFSPQYASPHSPFPFDPRGSGANQGSAPHPLNTPNGLRPSWEGPKSPSFVSSPRMLLESVSAAANNLRSRISSARMGDSSRPGGTRALNLGANRGTPGGSTLTSKGRDMSSSFGTAQSGTPAGAASAVKAPDATRTAIGSPARAHSNKSEPNKTSRPTSSDIATKRSSRSNSSNNSRGSSTAGTATRAASNETSRRRIDGVPVAQRAVVMASQRERTAVMEGTEVQASARPLKPPTSRNPLVVGDVLRSRGGEHHRQRGLGPLSIRMVQVMSGDTLAVIAQKHGMRIRDLQRLNNLKSENIAAGQVLRVATGWLWRTVPPSTRPGIRRTSRPLFSRNQIHAAIPAPASVKGTIARLGMSQPRSLLGIGGPAITTRTVRMLAGKFDRGPKGFHKGYEGWLRFASPLIDGFVSSSFGWRWGSFHEGVDLAADQGSPILASDRGTVTFSGWNGAYGKLVTIAHDGGFSTRYGHCSSLTARVGQRVGRGQQIACVGSTGRATGPHVHFEVRKNGEALDPFKWCDL